MVVVVVAANDSRALSPESLAELERESRGPPLRPLEPMALSRSSNEADRLSSPCTDWLLAVCS